MQQEQRMPWPLDESTGFPLPLLPLTEAPDTYNRDGTLYHTDPDEHHFFFPRRLFNSEELGPGGKVVRITRLQTVRRHHHIAAHKLMEPPSLSLTQDAQFYLSVLALSGYVPAQAIDVRGSQPIVRGLSGKQYRQLRESTVQGFENSYHRAIGRFFLQAVTEAASSCLDEELRQEFLETKHQKRRAQLGQVILKNLSHRAVEPINQPFSEAKKQGLIPPYNKSAFKIAVDYGSQGRPEQFFDTVLRVA